MNENFMKALAKDADEILALYKSQLGRKFCPWDKNYPTMKNIETDLSLDSLFIMRGDNDELIAAISIDHDDEVDNLDCWNENLKPYGELSRLAVNVKYQNQGIARKMILCVMEILRERRYKGIHFLVNKHNNKAIASYSKLNFDFVGERFMYEQPFLCYEKKL